MEIISTRIYNARSRTLALPSRRLCAAATPERLFTKADLHSRADAVRYALRQGKAGRSTAG